MKRNRLGAIILMLASVALTSTAPIVAQEGAASSSAPEVGVLVGLTHISGGGDDVTVIGIPGGIGGLGGPVYLSAPVGGRGSVRVETSLLAVSDNETLTLFQLGGYGTMSLGGGASGPYVLGGGSLLSASGGGDSETEFSVGGGLGTRFIVGSAGVVRLEARYNRFLSDGGPNTIQILLGFGARIG